MLDINALSQYMIGKYFLPIQKVAFSLCEKLLSPYFKMPTTTCLQWPMTAEKEARSEETQLIIEVGAPPSWHFEIRVHLLVSGCSHRPCCYQFTQKYFLSFQPQ